MSPGHIRDWCAFTGNRITREEFPILLYMDARYREAWQIERQNMMAMIERERSTQGAP